MKRKIGLIVGREGTFPQAFIDRVNELSVEGITAEFVKLGGTQMAEESPYGCIVDRISHEVKYYRGYLKTAALAGTYIINNPFWWSADDKFFNYSVASRLGVAVPRTILLPSKSYPPDIWPESLRNLVYPLDWDAIVEHVGLPAILKPFEGGGWKSVYKVNSKDELIRAFDETGELCMTLQQFVHFQHYVRCFCFGKESITPVKYDPHNRRYLVEHAHLSSELGERIVRDAQTLNRALGYDMNTVEFAIEDGVPYAIDFLNPAPDMDRHSITEFYFSEVVERMARLAIDRTLSGTFQDMQPRWPEMVGLTSDDFRLAIGD